MSVFRIDEVINTMFDVGRAIKRPFSDIKTLIIGIILGFIPFVQLLALGFALRSGKKASQGDFTLGEFDDWGGLFMKGLIAAVIAVVYMIPAGIVFGLTMALSFGAMMTALFSGDVSALSGAMLAGGVGGIVMTLLYLIAGYLLPMALLKYANEGSIGAAFGFGDIIHKALNVEYLITWIVAGIIVGLVSGVSFGLLAFPMMVFAFTAYGEVYSKQ
jgi:hypothetical protein